MSDTTSCLILRLSNYIDLDDRLQDLIGQLEKREVTFKSGALIHREGDTAENMYVVKQGWFLSSTSLPDGGRLVVKVHHPGDIIGFSGVAFEDQSLDLKACTDGVLCPFAKQDLDVIIASSPRLTALLFTIALRDQVLFIDRLKAVSRMRAQPRLAQFLLELLVRLRGTHPKLKNEFRLPLTQTEIGDAIGLTNVSVSKTFSSMEEEKLLKRTDETVILLEEDQLKELCAFNDRHTTIDTSWFPKNP